ncbi:MAG: M48 family metallopeptidase [bacterium]
MRSSFRGVRPRLLVVTLSLALASCATVGQLNIVSDQQESEMGQQFAGELDKELVYIDDPQINAYVNDLGQSIVRVCQRNDIPYRFKVVNTDEVNAFAVPGGYLFVDRGLIEAADSECELAGVLGHEIGHVVGRHSARQVTQKYGISAIAGLLLGQNPSMLAQVTAQIASTGAVLSYSREMESEADSYGVQEMYDLGVDPGGLASFFDKLVQMRGGSGGGKLEQFFSTHPDPGGRAVAVRAQIAKLPPKPGLRKDSPRFQQIKAKVKALPKAPPPKATN